MNSRHNKYVSVTDWFAPPPSTDKVSTTVNETSVISAGGASFSGGSWGQGGSGGGSSITIIKTNDTTPESNSNVYSALRVHDSFIAKNKNERTSGKLSSDVGFEVGEFVSGASGAIMYIDPETLQTSAEVDRLKVRIKAYFETLEIVNVNSVGGKQIISPAGAITCAKVEVKGPILKEVQSTDEFGNLLYDDNGNPIIETIVVSEDNGIPEDTYRCYFLAEQDGDKVENRWHVGDQAYCQTFNAFDGEQSQVSNTYYWRLVTSVTTNPVEIDGKQWHYIDLSISDCDTDSDVPKEGDVICHRGSRTENDRRNLLEFSAVDTFSPSITLYQGVGVLDEEKGLYPYSLANKDIISYGVNKTSNKAFMNVYGDMYVGDREGNSFIRFDEVGGLTIKGNLSAGTTLGDSDLTLEQRIEAASQAYKEDINAFKDAVIKSFNDVQNQIDGAIETYFLDPVPTLDNEPAVQWNTDEIKASHVGDLYYSAEGNAYRFQYTTITNEDGSISNSYYWNKINDTDIVTALANAKRALDTADSKRKIFVQQPKTNESYEIGDMWANATYIDPITNLVVYEGDLLRAVTIKLQGQAFSIDHWELASKYTDDSAAIAAMEAAKNAQNTADKAQADATAASNRLNSWAADGVISPTEKKGIKEEYARVIADKDHIDEEYDKYFLGTPTNYNNAYTPYITALIELFTSKSETVLIPDNFETILTTYYTERTNALNEISSAAKKVADDAQAAADNAMKEAEEALTVASDAKNVAYDMNFAITGSTEYVRDAFADGIINKGERATIQNQVKQIETIQAQVEESYKEVVSNTLLNRSTELENLKTSYTRFVTATNELKTSISDISKLDSVANMDKAVFEGKYNNFNAAYSTYTQWLNACSKYIEYALNSRVDATLESLGTYGYLKDVLDNEKTTITGGVVLTTMLALGYTDENKEYHINAGIDGGAAKNNDIVFWAGGSNIDKKIEPDNPQAADFLIRGDGTGYAAGGNFWWDSSGTIYADPLSFIISEQSVGMLLASFLVEYGWNPSSSKYEPYAIDPKIPFTTLQIASDFVLHDSAVLHFGDAELGYDTTNNAVYLRSKDGNPINFYTTGAISMYGLGNTSVTTIMDAILYDDATLGINSNGELYVKGSIGGQITFKDIANVGNWADSVADVDRIMYQQAGSSNWVAKSLSSIGGGGGVSGDYLPLSGGTLTNKLNIHNTAYVRNLIDLYAPYTDGAYITCRDESRTVNVGLGARGALLDYYNGSVSSSLTLNQESITLDTNSGANTYTLIHSGNYSSYALPLTGGTIAISSYEDFIVKRNANGAFSGITYSNANEGALGYIGVGGADSSYPYQPMFVARGKETHKIWHSGNDGSGSGLDADLLDGVQESGFCRHLDGVPITSHRGIGYGYEGQGWIGSGPALSVGYSGDNYLMQLQAPADYTALHFRNRMNGTWGDWKIIAFTDSNVASATKLQTARTIWGQSFDGAGNVSGALSDVTGITFKNDYYGLVIDEFGNFSFKKPYSTTSVDWSFKDSSGNKLMIVNNYGNVGIGTPNPNAKLHIVNNTNTSTGLRLDGGWSGYGFLYNTINIFLNGEQYGGIGVNTVSSAYGSTAAAGTYITNAKSGEYMNFYNEGGTFLKSSLLVNGGITMYSDQRKKTILNHVELSLKQIAEAPLIEHYYNSDEKKTTHVGSIAQYWASMNDWFCKLDNEGYYTMEIQNAALASAISIARELDRYETKTDKTIKQLKKRICQLEEEVERLRAS